MFLTILLLSYTIPAIYLFIRIWMLFIPKEQRLKYVLVYSFLFSLYPVSRSLEGTFGEIVKIISNYLLPCYLYLFLIILLIDIILIFNYFLRIIPRTALKDQTLRTKIFITAIGISVTVVIAGIINFNTIRTTEYNIEVPGRSSGIKNLRIAFVSDFHIDDRTQVRFVEKYIKNIEAIRPDLMLYGGDIVEGENEDQKMTTFEKLLSRIETRYGVYGVLGNHEHYSGQDKGGFFNRSGILILRDTAFILGNSFILAGRNDSHLRNRKNITEILKYVPDSLPAILLDHRPTEIDSVSKTLVDIQLSGHTHNGQLFPINFITRKVYKLSYGYRKIGNTHFFVSSGIRLWGPPVRTTGKSEIIVINVAFK